MILRKKLLFFLAISLFAVSCKRDAEVIEVKENIKLIIPDGWPQLDGLNRNIILKTIL